MLLHLLLLLLSQDCLDLLTASALRLDLSDFFYLGIGQVQLLLHFFQARTLLLGQGKG